MKEMLKSMYIYHNKRVMTKKSVQSVMNERVLLSQFNSPFIVNMHFAFQDRDTLYLMLDLMEGGDLRYHVGNRVFNELQSS
jgi:serine/threonine protein kinase